MLNDPVPTLVVLGDQPVYRLSNPDDPETMASGSVSLPATPSQNIPKVDDHDRSARLVLSLGSHIGIGEALGLRWLSEFYVKADRTFEVRTGQSVRAEELQNRQVILIGNARALRCMRDATFKDEFVIAEDGTIRNPFPRFKEQTEYHALIDEPSGSLQTDYALITIRPNRNDQHLVMELVGLHSQSIEAAVEFMTTRTNLELLNQQVRQLNHPDEHTNCFQALLRVKVEANRPTTTTLEALHPLALRHSSRPSAN